MADGSSSGRISESPLSAGKHADFLLEDPRDIAALLRDAATEITHAFWSAGGGGSAAGTLAVDASHALLFMASDGAALSGEGRLSFTLHGVPVRVECRLAEGRLADLKRICISESRMATRVVPSEPVRIEWYSSSDEGVSVNQAPLLDFGRNGGRSFHAPGSPLPGKGTFPATIVTTGASLHCMAEVRSTTRTPRGIELGLSLVAEDPAALADVILHSLFPEVKLRREVPVPELERLFRASGYHRLRDGAVPSAEWAAMDADAITRDIVYAGQDGAAVAHGSMTRVYRNTWLGHQMAMRSDHPEAARARRIQTAMIMITSLVDGHEAKSMAYYDAAKPYGRVFFDRFVEAVANPELATISSFDWIDWSEAAAEGAGVPSHVSVSVAAPSELAAVADLVRRQLPQLQADAMDIRPSLLRSDALHPAYRGSLLSRGREVFVARSRGKIVGAALCEHTSKHLNLLNELNLAQLYFVPGVAEPTAQRALQEVVRSFYAERGILDPFVVAPSNTFDLSVDPTSRIHMRIRCITWSFEGIRAYENYLKLRCAWLERGRRPRSSTRTKKAVNA
jgi:hypothetical protein